MGSRPTSKYVKVMVCGGQCSSIIGVWGGNTLTRKTRCVEKSTTEHYEHTYMYEGCYLSS